MARGEGADRTSWRPAPWTVVWLLAGLVGLAALANAAPWIAAPPGDSHDGRNAAVWGLAARAFREDPIGSRLGGRQPDGEPYADHPPAIIVATAVATIPGEGGIALRVPSIAASVASLALLVALLRRMGYSPLATGCAVVLTATSAMFLTYGFMLDTPMVGLPLALAGLLVARRIQQGDAPPTWAIASAGVGAGLTSWQGALTVVLVAVAVAVPPASRARRLVPAAVLAGATIAGGALSVAWAWWAFGSLEALRASFELRNGDPGGWWTFQRAAVGDLFGPVLVVLALAGTATALVRRRHVAITGVVLGVSVLWVLLFRQGASIHDYWLYFAVLAVGLGTAAVVDALEVAVARWLPDLDRVVRIALAVGVGVIGLTSVLGSSIAEDVVASGADGGRVASHLPRAPSVHAETVVAMRSLIPGGARWASLATHGTVGDAGSGELARRIGAEPDLLVLIRQPPGTEAPPAIRRGAIARSGPFYVVPIAVCVEVNARAFETLGPLGC